MDMGIMTAEITEEVAEDALEDTRDNYVLTDDQLLKRLHEKARRGDFDRFSIKDFIMLMENSSLPEPNVTCAAIPVWNVNVESVHYLGKLIMFTSMAMFMVGCNTCIIQRRKHGHSYCAIKPS